MSTITRAELSEKNQYHIEKHRYYELKHFCLQYPIWKKAYSSLDGLSKRPADLEIFSKTGVCSNPTERCAIAKEEYSRKIDMVENAAFKTDPVIGTYILMGVTEGLSYDTLQAKYNVPCCRENYYDLYRRFFYILNKVRD